MQNTKNKKIISGLNHQSGDATGSSYKLNTKQNLEKELDNFIDTLPERVAETPREVLRDFIRQSHLSLISELEEKIEELPLNLEAGNEEHQIFANGFTKAKEDILELLNQFKQK